MNDTVDAYSKKELERTSVFINSCVILVCPYILSDQTRVRTIV